MTLFNSRLRLFPGKLKSRWLGLIEITKVLPYGVVENMHPEKGTFKVNGQRLKQYYGSDMSTKKVVLLLNTPQVKE